MRLTWLFLLFGVALAIVTSGLVLQWMSNRELRDEVALYREQADNRTRLEAEQQRLRAAQLPAAEQAALRADHAAVVRIRNEVESLRTQVEQAEREAKR
jgi:hypothetical protein